METHASPVIAESEIPFQVLSFHVDSPVEDEFDMAPRAPTKRGCFRSSRVFSARLRLSFEDLDVDEDVPEASNFAKGPPAPIKKKKIQYFKMASVKRKIKFEDATPKRDA